MSVVKEPPVRPQTTRLSVLVQEVTQEIHLLAAENLKRRTCVRQTPADPVHNVRLVLTGPELTGQSVPVQQATGETLLSGAQEVNVSMTVNVRWTELALITTAGLRVRMPVVRMPSVKQETMELSAPAPQDLLETLSLPVDSPEDPRRMWSDSQDSNVTWIPTFYFSLRTDKSDPYLHK